ncbi:MAG: hypothetical protein KAJ03_10590 [Gammaproteobacteria bacterium]|nr:hypothetical protein [Gammaproteobacteria bacterium]
MSNKTQPLDLKRMKVIKAMGDGVPGWLIEVSGNPYSLNPAIMTVEQIQEVHDRQAKWLADALFESLPAETYQRMVGEMIQLETHRNKQDETVERGTQ